MGEMLARGVNGYKRVGYNEIMGYKGGGRGVALMGYKGVYITYFILCVFINYEQLIGLFEVDEKGAGIVM